MKRVQEQMLWDKREYSNGPVPSERARCEGRKEGGLKQSRAHLSGKARVGSKKRIFSLSLLLGGEKRGGIGSARIFAFSEKREGEERVVIKHVPLLMVIS